MLRDVQVTRTLACCSVVAEQHKAVLSKYDCLRMGSRNCNTLEMYHLGQKELWQCQTGWPPCAAARWILTGQHAAGLRWTAFPSALAQHTFAYIGLCKAGLESSGLTDLHSTQERERPADIELYSAKREVRACTVRLIGAGLSRGGCQLRSTSEVAQSILHDLGVRGYMHFCTFCLTDRFVWPNTL